MFPVAILATLAAVAPVSDILVVDFTGKEKATTHTWRTNNDPVMGGKSYSTVSIENGLLNFTGAVRCLVHALTKPLLLPPNW